MFTKNPKTHTHTLRDEMCFFVAKRNVAKFVCRDANCCRLLQILWAYFLLSFCSLLLIVCVSTPNRTVNVSTIVILFILKYLYAINKLCELRQRQQIYFTLSLDSWQFSSIKWQIFAHNASRQYALWPSDNKICIYAILSKWYVRQHAQQQKKF